jgi:salicylate hydroxylase
LTASRVLIAGGGIGGLSAALALAQQGFEVAVFERAPSFTEFGAGIQLSPNCTRVLFDLGLEEPLRRIAFAPDGSEIRDWRSARVIARSTWGDRVLSEHGFPYFHIHREDLMEALTTAASNNASIELHNNCAVTDLHEDDAGITVQISNGQQFSGDLLIGADGIRSSVRESMFVEQPPVFTGNVAWRALVPASSLPPGLISPNATVWWGPGGHFVHYYVRNADLVNCVCVVEKTGWEIESWTQRGMQHEIKSAFTGWHRNVQQLIDNIPDDDLFKWALFDRRPLTQWSRGRVTLLGDACHPTLPFLAQGAAMAIEDAAVLSRCLKTGTRVETSLQKYETLRRPRTARIQQASRRNASIFHMRGLKTHARNLFAPMASAQILNWLYSYDALTAHL